MSEDLNALMKMVEAGQTDAAEPGLVAFVEANPRQPAAQFYLGIIRLKQGRNAEAAEAYRAAARGLPGVAAVHSNLALAAHRAGEPEAARTAARRAALLAPDGSGPYVVTSEAAAASEDPAAALRAAKLAFCLEPKSQCGLMLEAARKAGDTPCVEAAVARLMATDPTDRAASINGAHHLLKNGYGAEAERLYRNILEHHPNDPDLWFNLGVTLIESDRFEDAAEPYARRARLVHGRPLNDAPAYADMPAEPVVPVDRTCARHRLKHDAEQYRYLTERGVLPPEYRDEWKTYQELLDTLGPEDRDAISFKLDDARYGRIARSYNRFVHIAATGWEDADPMNPDLDWSAIEESYLDAAPQAVAIDALLNEEALAAIRRFCFESTIWHQLKGAGYLGAYYRSGFNDPLLFAIGRGLRERMPRVLGPHGLKLMWAYKYDQHMSGINPHADFAAVNVNFWINHAESNLDPESGGLLVFRKPAPKDWTFQRYNTAPAEEIYAALGEDRNNPIRVPNRENRALLFDSRLFHETDRFTFKDGYIHRRINITMLFGHGGT
ncbi:MAG: tetratricopeptide repeat protein [Nisaea sp.]|uniref:tetratricopeptide repeat protein n=1 Tax=Nisaea sp. TaxID=2024842 RepID=UPI001B2EF47F|nr:tetratricopeptide repeat protein [Nisaea sp.]MBO6559577.1 tetratricopeptide repeat protein [Nisaea sp.]